MRTKFSCFYIFQQIKIITFVQRQSVQMQPLSKISDPQTMRGTRWQGREGWLAGSRRAWGGAEQVGVTSIQTPGNSGLASESPNYPTCWDDHRRIFGKQPLSKPKQTTMNTSIFLPVLPHPKTLSFPCQILNPADRRRVIFVAVCWMGKHLNFCFGTHFCETLPSTVGSDVHLLSFHTKKPVKTLPQQVGDPRLIQDGYEQW